MIYSYFISYWAMGDDSHTGYGNFELNTDRPIDSYDRINSLQEQLKTTHPQFKQVIILHWKRFE